MEGYILSALLAVAVLILLVFILKKSKELNELQVQNAKNEEALKDFEEFKTEIEKVIEEKNETEKELAKALQKLEMLEKIEVEYKKLQETNALDKARIKELETKLSEGEKAYKEKIEFIKNSEEKLKESFTNLANEIFEKTNEKMTKTSEVTLSQILNPLQSQMKEFRDRIENLSKDEAGKISALENELKSLKELSYKLSDDANNLTKALKGEKKLQGSWGEMVLEKVLEMSGLRKGIEYEREVSLKNDENKTYRPDVIVHLPNSRDIIIDSKVSLNAYNEYVKENNEADLNNHIKALKHHIDTLAEKKYENLKGVNSLDFIFMFVPIENALNLALENSDLFEYAFKKRVVLVSPSTLLVSLRAIEASWRYERQAENIKEVIKTAENLYDKVRGFTEDFEKIGKSLDSAKDTYEKAKGKLTTGRGNVIRQIAILKEKAGIKPKKEISQEFQTLANLGGNDD